MWKKSVAIAIEYKSPKEVLKTTACFLLFFRTFIFASRWHSKFYLSQLQLVQNAAVRLLSDTKKWDHISSLLASLHWLSVTYRIDFKILLKYRIDFKIIIFVFKALHRLALGCISELLTNHWCIPWIQSNLPRPLTSLKPALQPLFFIMKK